MTEKKEKTFSNVMWRLQNLEKFPIKFKTVVDDATVVPMVGMVNVCMQKYLYT